MVVWPTSSEVGDASRKKVRPGRTLPADSRSPQAVFT